MSIPNPYPNIADKEINDVKTWSSAKIVNELQPALDTEITYEVTYEGNIITFNNLTNKEITSLECEILPIQEGTGTPSPSNPRPISGTSVLNVEHEGKNLFDISQFATLYPQYCTFENDVLNIQGNVVLYSTGVEVKAPTGAKLSATVTDITSVNARFRLVYTDGSYSDVYPNQLPFSLLKDLASVRLNWSTNGTFKIENAQIEINSTATTYEPYTGTTYTVNLGRTVYGGSADVVGGVGTNAFSDLDLSSLEWTYSSTYQRFSTTSQVAGIKTPPNNNTVANILCSHFDSDNSNNTGEVGKDNIIGVSMTGVIQIRDTSLNGDISALMTLLENVDFVYELATPTDFTFDGVTVECLEGINNIWTDTGDIKVTTTETETIGNILKERGILP